MLFLASLLFSCDNDDSLNPEVETSAVAHLFATSKDGSVKKFDINNGDKTSFKIASSSTEGIHFSPGEDAFVIVSRSSLHLQAYSGISNYRPEQTHNLSVDFASTSDLFSPRDLAVSGEFYVVSDNSDVDYDESTADGRFFVYEKTAEGFRLRNILTTDFNVWGVEFEGEDLYAAVDKTNQVAIFNDFINSNKSDKAVSPTKKIGIEGLVQIHGLDYEDGTLVVSDIGDPASNTDGAIHVITDFNSKLLETANGGNIGLTVQTVISGAKTLLGNPVNLVYDAAYNVVFVAEQANGGGRILAFTKARSANSNIAPNLNYKFSGVNSLEFYTE
ncbi:hypothetical protein LPB144_11620 [Christiangramia salexigens]|uniref:SMP-30/Gluconolactonase/LRE-like region domain-containing protein n=1 Tax=Christiangramia salexigens TaxID=1913577 RepID=A0A1L3J8P6_9FLAO|nr:hypothetical protein LPB144_11620 [Christiangramia salexigens]